MLPKVDKELVVNLIVGGPFFVYKKCSLSLVCSALFIGRIVSSLLFFDRLDPTVVLLINMGLSGLCVCAVWK